MIKIELQVRLSMDTNCSSPDILFKKHILLAFVPDKGMLFTFGWKDTGVQTFQVKKTIIYADYIDDNQQPQITVEFENIIIPPDYNKQDEIKEFMKINGWIGIDTYSLKPV